MSWKWGFKALEKNLLPDWLIRKGIRKLHRERLDIELSRGIESGQDHFRQYLSELKKSPIAVQTEMANEQHYELPAEFFRLVLGKRLKYSGGYWPVGVSTLDESEEAMLRLYGERAQLEDGMDILELGCGWGSLSLWLGERYPASRVVAVSNSTPQRSATPRSISRVQRWRRVGRIASRRCVGMAGRPASAAEASGASSPGSLEATSPSTRTFSRWPPSAATSSSGPPPGM